MQIVLEPDREYTDQEVLWQGLAPAGTEPPQENSPRDKLASCSLPTQSDFIGSIPTR